MAENVEITAGTGTTIAADDISAVKYQKVKLVDGTSDSTTVIASGGGVEASALRVTIASDSTGVVSIDDNGGAITVDGTVAVTGMTACNTGAVVVSSGAITETNSGAIKTAVELIDNAISGSEMQVDVVGALPAGTALIGKVSIDQSTANANEVVVKSGTVTAVTSITNAVAVTNAGITSIDGKVTACNTGAVVLAAGTAEVGKLAAGTAIIGKVGIDQTTDGTTNKVAAVCTNAGTFAVQAAQATAANLNCTEASGSAIATSLAIIDDWDSTDACKVRVQVASTRVQGKVDNADTTTAREVLAAVASNYVMITSFVISVAAAGNYWLEDGDAAQLTPKFYLAANGGVSWTAVGDTPYKTTTVNKAINVKGSTAGAVGVMLTGYTTT